MCVPWRPPASWLPGWMSAGNIQMPLHPKLWSHCVHFISKMACKGREEIIPPPGIPFLVTCNQCAIPPRRRESLMFCFRWSVYSRDVLFCKCCALDFKYLGQIVVHEWIGPIMLLVVTPFGFPLGLFISLLSGSPLSVWRSRCIVRMSNYTAFSYVAHAPSYIFEIHLFIQHGLNASVLVP